MFDLDGFVVDFVAAARDGNNDKMVELSESIAELSAELKVEALEKIIAKLKEAGDAEEIEKGLSNTLELMKFALQVQDSGSADTKDQASEEADSTEVEEESKVEEGAEDAPADTAADEAEGSKSNEGGDTVAESEGNAAAQEEQEQKS